MEEEIVTTADGDRAAFALGEMMGRRQAFGTIAGRCSAADAECLRRIREESLFQSRAATWEEFCPKYLGLSRSQANRIIRTLEEFGPAYFELAQLTRITPEQFRAIAPAVRDQHIHAEGQAIALLPENAGKIAAAVAGLRREAVPPEAAKDDAVAAVDRRAQLVLTDILRLVRGKPAGLDRLALRGIIREAIAQLRAFDLEMGI